jgi:phosphopantothenoylcysteine decarboxylase/phosphopantothenate--cysteine ligase
VDFTVMDGKRVLLIVAGGIAAYKTPDLVRRLREKGAIVRCVLTKGGEQFITPLTLAAVSGQPVHQDIFSLTEESEMGHIRLAKEADLVIIAPATADILARMAAGMANDLATTALLATEATVLAAPAMNTRMWLNAATQANLATLQGRGVRVVGPGEGDLACGDTGPGRMAEVTEIVAAAEAIINGPRPLSGLKALVTSGPTYEPIDPVRFISNRSSGKQGHAVAAALAELGAQVTLITGPVRLPDPVGVETVHVESAREMLGAALGRLPVDVAVCAAAVADWTVSNASKEKRKKEAGGQPPTIELTPNPDILATLSERGTARPRLVIGFAAETEKLLEHAQSKLERKGCDWILANDVSPASGTFGGDSNKIHLLSAHGVEEWPRMTKLAVAERLAKRIAEILGGAK